MAKVDTVTSVATSQNTTPHKSSVTARDTHNWRVVLQFNIFKKYINTLLIMSKANTEF